MTLSDQFGQFVKCQYMGNAREIVPDFPFEKWIMTKDPRAMFSYEDGESDMICVKFSDGSSGKYLAEV